MFTEKCQIVPYEKLNNDMSNSYMRINNDNVNDRCLVQEKTRW